MPTFLVRMNCEYALQVEAEDETKAKLKATKTPPEEWDKAWSEMDVEETG